MSNSLAAVVRRRINHFRGEILVTRKKADVARSLGDAALANRLEEQLRRARLGAAVLEQALGEWLHLNAREARAALEPTEQREHCR